MGAQCLALVVTNHTSEGDLEICHCLTDKMAADCHTEPLQGKKFKEFCEQIMGFVQCMSKQCIVHRSVLDKLKSSSKQKSIFNLAMHIAE